MSIRIGLRWRGVYEINDSPCLQTRNHPSSRVIQFPRTLAHSDLLELFREITGEVLTEDEHASLAEEFSGFAQKFARDVGLGGWYGQPGK